MPTGVTQRQETPLTVSWIVVERAEKSVKLVARVERRSLLAVPVNVVVLAPKAVSLSGGPTAFAIPAADAPGIIDTVYLAAFSTAPTEDLVLTADARGVGFGVHAQDAYRFGRPAPGQEKPAATGPHLQLGGQDLGPAVPLEH